MNYKLLMSDLDGTLLDDNMDIPAANVTAIKEAKKEGVKFVMASGRMKPLVDRYIEELELDEEDYVVCSNGACIYTTKNNSIIYEKKLDHEYAKHILKEAEKFDVFVHLYDNDGVYSKNITERERELFTKSNLQIHDYDPKRLLDIDITKIILVGLNKTLLEAQRHFRPYVEGKINMTFSSPFYLEFFSMEADKGIALQFLAERLSIKKEQVIAIGDNYNDLRMISSAGLGVAVANAVPELKSGAGYISSSTNNEGVIYEVAKRFILPLGRIQ